MARPQKQTVDYFPHDANASDGDTLTILQGRWGNDGYAFWFKLLEKLASSEGHVIDCRNPVRWQLLLAKTQLSEEVGETIMEVLAGLDAIDPELWRYRVIWCQHLVDNVADVYKNRRREIPQKPIVTERKAITTGDKAITTDDNPQSKVEKSKEKKRERRGRGNLPGTPGSRPPPSLTGSFLFESLVDTYPEAFGKKPNSRETAQLRDLGKEISSAGGATAEQIRDAFKEAATQNKFSVRYVRAILFDWLDISRAPPA